MPIPSRRDEILLGKRAYQWISYMHHRQHAVALRMLAHDCGLLGVQMQPHCSFHFPMSSLKWLPHLEVRRVFSFDNAVSLHVELVDSASTIQNYRFYFQFRFAKITKLHLSVSLEELACPFEQPKFELKLAEVWLP